MTEYSPHPPRPIGRSAMVMRWEELTFCHWRYEPSLVQALLPDGLEVETYDSSAWLGLVPFKMRVRPPFSPWLGSMFDFPETNVRTYVRGPNGESGVWFFSLEAAHLPAVLTARATYHMPYHWAHMQLAHAHDVVTYTSRRRWPGPRGAHSALTVKVGEPFSSDELGDLDHFLTARWALFGHGRRGLTFARAWHEPWPLHHAEVLAFGDELVGAAGLPAPTEPALVHWSPGVEVRVGFPHRL